MFFSFTLSKSLISISFAGICLIGLLDFFNVKLTLKEKWFSSLFILFYGFIFLSYFNSEDTEEATRKLILKLPILFFPLVLFAVKNIAELTKFRAILALNYAFFVPGFISVYNYLINKQLFDQLILESKPLPIEFGYGIYHIQFSILMAIAVLLGVFLFFETLKKRKLNWIGYGLIFLVICNFIFIHILSARTGLLALYIGLSFFVAQVFTIIQLKQRLILTFFVFLIPIVLFVFSSSLQNRVKNSVEDFKVVWNNANANDYSFAMRVKAWKNGISVIGANFFFGTGIGDADKVLEQNFEKEDASILPQNRRNPHFQTLETWVQSGVFAALMLVCIWVFSFFRFKEKYNWHFLALVSLLFVASCFESILERQVSVIAFSFFIAFVLVKIPKIETHDSH